MPVLDVTASSARGANDLLRALSTALWRVGAWIDTPDVGQLSSKYRILATVRDLGYDPETGQGRLVSFTEEELQAVVARALTNPTGVGSVDFRRVAMEAVPSGTLQLDDQTLSLPQPRSASMGSKGATKSGGGSKVVEPIAGRAELMSLDARTTSVQVRVQDEIHQLRLDQSVAEEWHPVLGDVQAEPKYIGPNNGTVLVMTEESSKDLLRALTRALQQIS